MSLRGAQSATKQSSKNNAFTLAEIMIVLTVIGILTAILLPAARQITPDENVIKFKKAHNTLHTVIRELVTSDKYYLDGDLAYRANGARIDGTHSGDYSYFCETIGEILTFKKKTCRNTAPAAVNESEAWVYTFEYVDNENDISSSDNKCKAVLSLGAQEELILPDGTVFYIGNTTPFGVTNWDSGVSIRNDAFHETWGEPNGFYGLAKLICIDIDGLDSGEDPFGYGIRVDGKILNGPRATQWLTKTIQGED